MTKASCNSILTEKEPAAQSAVVFHCSACGECCSSVNIPLDAAKAEALLQKPWVQQRLQQTATSLIKTGPHQYQMPLTETGYCVFLSEEDKHCLIHRREGLALKPLECQRFPFAAIRQATDTLGFDASASCSVVANQLLQAFQPIVPDDPLSILPVEPHFPTSVQKTRWQRLSREDYRVYQEQITQCFALPAVSAETALHQVYRWLHQHPSLPSSVIWQPNPLWQRVIPAWWLRKPYGWVSQWAIWTGGDYADPKIFGQDVFSLQGLSAVQWPDDPSTDQNLLLKGFLHNVLRRQVVLAHGHSLESLLTVSVIGLQLVQWYAKALGMLQDKSEVHVTDVSMAIRLVDRYYTGHQPRFLEQLRRWPWHGVFQRLFFAQRKLF